MAAGLPEISGAEEDTSSSSSSGSSTSKASSSSSSSSKGTNTKKPTNPNSPSSSSSSSSESSDGSDSDSEDWSLDPKKKPNTEHGQLVRDDGEVRYPVRSWMTPCKQQASASEPTTIKVILPVKTFSEDARLQQRKELEEKRSRVVQKMREASNKTKVKATPSRRKATTTNSSTVSKQLQRKAPATRKVVAAKKEPTPDENRTHEVLTALQLSAKKQPPAHCEESTNLAKGRVTQSRLPAVVELDDNAVSNVFAKATEPSDVGKNIAAQPSPRKVVKTDALPGRTRGKRNPAAAPVKQKSSTAAATAEETPSESTNKDGVPSEIPMCKFKIQAAASAKYMKRANPTKTAESSKDTVKPKETSTKPTATRKTTEASKKAKSSDDKKTAVEEDKPKAKATKKKSEKSKEEKPIKTKEVAKESPPETKQLSSPLEPVETQAEAEQQVQKAQEVPPPMPTPPPLPPLPPEPTPSAPLPPPPPPTPPATASNEVDEDNSSDAESDEVWSTVRFTDDQAITLVYQGPEGLPPPPEKPRPNFDNFRMDVAIDDQLHTWRISRDYNLFSRAPTDLASSSPAIKTVPKKRKVCIQAVSHDPTVDTTQHTSGPMATSTPHIRQNEVNIEESPHSTTPDLPATKPSTSTPTTTSLSVVASVAQRDTATSSATPSNEADKIQMADIELILSHLHGN